MTPKVIQNKSKFRRLRGRKWFPLREKEIFSTKRDAQTNLGQRNFVRKLEYNQKSVRTYYYKLVQFSSGVWNILMDRAKCKYCILYCCMTVEPFYCKYNLFCFKCQKGLLYLVSYAKMQFVAFTLSLLKLDKLDSQWDSDINIVKIRFRLSCHFLRRCIAEISAKPCEVCRWII